MKKTSTSLFDSKLSATAVIIHTVCLTISTIGVMVAIVTLYLRKEATTIVINKRLLEPLFNSENYIALGAISILLLTMTMTSFINTRRAGKCNEINILDKEENARLHERNHSISIREEITKRLADREILKNEGLKKDIEQLKEEIKSLKEEQRKKEVPEKETDLRQQEIRPRNKRIARALKEASLTR